jgi:hypothetical protein
MRIEGPAFPTVGQIAIARAAPVLAGVVDVIDEHGCTFGVRGSLRELAAKSRAVKNIIAEYKRNRD